MGCYGWGRVSVAVVPAVSGVVVAEICERVESWNTG